MTADAERPLPKKALNIFTIVEVLLVAAVLTFAAVDQGWLVVLTGWALLNVAFVRARVLRVYRRELVDAANNGRRIQ